MLSFDVTSITAIIAVIGVLVALVNIVVEVIKKATWDKIPTNILVILISITLTLVAFFAYCQICSISVIWYKIVAAVIVGIMVAYAAMFGYDKLKEALSSVITVDADSIITSENTEATIKATKKKKTQLTTSNKVSKTDNL
jgi:hypothetical protein